MDVNDFIPSAEPFALHLRNPATGAPLSHEDQPVVVYVLGQDAPEMQKIEREHADRRLKAAGRTGRVTVTSEEIEAETIERLTKALLAKPWQNLHRAGKPLEHNAENARWLLRSLPWLRDQVDEAYRDRGNFFQQVTEKTSGKG